MILRLCVFSILLVSLSCEIEDEFSKRDVTENKGTFLVREDFGVAKLLWYSPTNILIFQNGAPLKILNVDSKNTSDLTSNQLIYGLFGVTSDEKAVVSSYNENDGTYSLMAIDLNSQNPTVLTNALFLGGYPAQSPLVRGTKVVYSEPSLNVNSVFLHDVVTDERQLIFEQATPLAISPDGKQIVAWDQNNRGFIYDIEGGSITPINTLYDPAMRFYWNDEGIIGFQITYSNAVAVNVNNFTDPQKTFTVEGMQSEFLIISSDGEEFVYPIVKCANPHFVYHCYGSSAYVTLKGIDVPTRRESDVATFAPNPDQYSTVYFQSGDISPDGTQLVYVINNELYLQNIPN